MDKTETSQPEQSDQLVPLKTKEEYLADVEKYCREVYENCAKVADKLESVSKSVSAAGSNLFY